jgi:Uma2 family endonuclease
MASTILEETERIGPEAAGALLSTAEFDALTADDFEDGYRYELIRGVLIVTPIPSEAEADPHEILGHLLREYQEQHPQGKTLDKTLPERYVYTPDSRRRADRVIWTGLGRLPDPRRDVPSIVVEFVSRGRRNRDRDYSEKRLEYAAAGVRKYWIIDRFRRTMTISSVGNEGSAKELMERVVSEEEFYESPLLPGFSLPLARLLAVADAWKQGRS